MASPRGQSAPELKGTKFWHPFANMADVAGREIVFERGQGAWLWDTGGQKYLDATAGLWYCYVGHGRGELAEAAALQMRTLSSYSTFGNFANRPILELAERVCALAPIPRAVAFFTNGGSDGIDTAAKLIRRYWNLKGQPQRRLMVVREGAFHGMNAYGTSLAGIDINSAGYGELVSGVIRVDPNDPQALADVLAQRGTEIAAFFGEPVRGAVGVHPPAQGYWQQVERLCREHGVFLVMDEVVTGFGRLGSWFASERFGITPDLIVGAKGITSGYVPLGVVICGEKIQEPFWRESGSVFRHGYTYSGHAAAAAVGIANLDIIEREQLVDRVTELEPLLAAELTALTTSELVQEVRTVGLLAGVQLVPGLVKDHPELIEDVVHEARRHGVITRGLVGGSLQISPPLIISPDEIHHLVEVLADSLSVSQKKLS